MKVRQRHQVPQEIPGERRVVERSAFWPAEPRDYAFIRTSLVTRPDTFQSDT
jgi:hypothetical protein